MRSVVCGRAGYGYGQYKGRPAYKQTAQPAYRDEQGRKARGRVCDTDILRRSQKAAEVLNSFMEAYPDVHAEIKYDTPDYKVFVGAYLTEQQAREALSRLKQNPDYSGAFVRPKQITVYD